VPALPSSPSSTQHSNNRVLSAGRRWKSREMWSLESRESLVMVGGWALRQKGDRLVVHFKRYSSVTLVLFAARAPHFCEMYLCKHQMSTGRSSGPADVEEGENSSESDSSTYETRFKWTPEGFAHSAPRLNSGHAVPRFPAPSLWTAAPLLLSRPS
jgi:hypothetical protein